MKLLLYSFLFYGIFSSMVLHAIADENTVPDKRYIAALAKNGRLPKFSSEQKKDREIPPSSQVNELGSLEQEPQSDIFLEDKRHVGAFLKSRGRPSFAAMERNGRTDSNSDDDSSNSGDKRNVASLARMGRLNAIRYGSFNGHNVGGKRVNNNQMNDAISTNDEDNEIDVLDDPECYEIYEDVKDGVLENPNWIPRKRYVAALARSGRLPIWHPQRMWWGGKRDDSVPFRSSTMDGNDDRDGHENAIDETAIASPKNKRCKKIYEYSEQKRNIQALARNGKLPVHSKREEKRNIAALARNGKLPSLVYQKRNIAALARNGKLPSLVNHKRNIAALARNGKLPSFGYQSGKRSISSLARNRKLDDNEFDTDKSSNDEFPEDENNPERYDLQEEKRNVAALARNGKLPFRSNA